MSPTLATVMLGIAFIAGAIFGAALASLRPRRPAGPTELLKPLLAYRSDSELGAMQITTIRMSSVGSGTPQPLCPECGEPMSYEFGGDRFPTPAHADGGCGFSPGSIIDRTA